MQGRILPEKHDYVVVETIDAAGAPSFYVRPKIDKDTESLKDFCKLELQDKHHFEKKETPLCWSALHTSMSVGVQNLLEAYFADELAEAIQA